jgi:hypothetical protein
MIYSSLLEMVEWTNGEPPRGRFTGLIWCTGVRSGATR